MPQRMKKPMIAPETMKTKSFGKGDVCIKGASCVGGTDGEGMAKVLLRAGKEIDGAADDAVEDGPFVEVEDEVGPAVVDVAESERAGKELLGLGFCAKVIGSRKKAATAATSCGRILRAASQRYLMEWSSYACRSIAAFRCVVLRRGSGFVKAMQRQRVRL